MTFEMPQNASSPVSLMQPEAPFLLALRAFESVHEFQMEWWRAMSGLIGQLTPADAVPEAADAEIAGEAETEQPQPEASEAA